LTSVKQTSFKYGVNLPDLTLKLKEHHVEGLNYTYTITVSNSGKSVSGETTLAFADGDETVRTVPIPAIQPGAGHDVVFLWSGSGKAGYHNFLFYADTGETVKEFDEDNNGLSYVEAIPEMYHRLEVEPLVWPANSDITIISRLINNRDTAAAVTLNLTIVNDATGEVIFERERPEEIAVLGSKTVSDNFNTGVTPAGEYTVNQTLSADNVDLHDKLSVVIQVTKSLEAALTIQPQTISPGVETAVEAAMTLKNTGNVLLTDERVIIEVFNGDSAEVIKSEDLLISLYPGEEKSENHTLNLNLAEGNYEVRLRYGEEEIAVCEITAAAALKHRKEIDVQPRVLLMNPAFAGILKGKPKSKGIHAKKGKKGKKGDPGSSSSRAAFAYIAGLLQAREIENETARRLPETYLKFHKGHANVNILIGRPLGRNFGKELKERVWNGEGLIWVCDRPGNGPGWNEFTGVVVKKVPGKHSETTIRLLESELSGGGDVELRKKHRLRITKVCEEVRIIARTGQQKHPVMAIRQYGKGRILVITLPLELESGIEEMSQLLVNAVVRFSRDIYSGTELTRLLPIRFTLTNDGGAAKTVTVKESLTYGAEAYGYEPEPLEDGEELEWRLTVPAAGSVELFYWLRLPDEIGSYEAGTEIYEGGIKLAEEVLTLEVTREVLVRLDEIVVELELLEGIGRDARNIRGAVRLLEKVRNRCGSGFVDQLVNLFETIRAAHNLGNVRNVDVTQIRSQVGVLVRIMGRRFYDKVRQWGESHLTRGMLEGPGEDSRQ
ncbi:MAG: hypothetical protein GY757_29760, partial [bacterium]|nr:hypothetical protein [bacterium]